MIADKPVFQGYYALKPCDFANSRLNTFLNTKFMALLHNSGVETEYINSISILTQGQYNMYIKGKLPSCGGYLLQTVDPDDKSKILTVQQDGSFKGIKVTDKVNIRPCFFVNAKYLESMYEDEILTVEVFYERYGHEDITHPAASAEDECKDTTQADATIESDASPEGTLDVRKNETQDSVEEVPVDNAASIAQIAPSENSEDPIQENNEDGDDEKIAPEEGEEESVAVNVPDVVRNDSTPKEDANDTDALSAVAPENAEILTKNINISNKALDNNKDKDYNTNQEAENDTTAQSPTVDIQSLPHRIIVNDIQPAVSLITLTLPGVSVDEFTTTISTEEHAADNPTDDALATAPSANNFAQADDVNGDAKHPESENTVPEYHSETIEDVLQDIPPQPTDKPSSVEILPDGNVIECYEDDVIVYAYQDEHKDYGFIIDNDDKQLQEAISRISQTIRDYFQSATNEERSPMKEENVTNHIKWLQKRWRW